MSEFGMSELLPEFVEELTGEISGRTIVPSFLILCNASCSLPKQIRQLDGSTVPAAIPEQSPGGRARQKR